MICMKKQHVFQSNYYGILSFTSSWMVESKNLLDERPKAKKNFDELIRSEMHNAGKGNAYYFTTIKMICYKYQLNRFNDLFL